MPTYVCARLMLLSKSVVAKAALGARFFARAWQRLQRIQIVRLAICWVHSFRAFLVTCCGPIFVYLVDLVVLKLEEPERREQHASPGQPCLVRAALGHLHQRDRLAVRRVPPLRVWAPSLIYLSRTYNTTGDHETTAFAEPLLHLHKFLIEALLPTCRGGWGWRLLLRYILLLHNERSLLLDRAITQGTCQLFRRWSPIYNWALTLITTICTTYFLNILLLIAHSLLGQVSGVIMIGRHPITVALWAGALRLDISAHKSTLRTVLRFLWLWVH